MVWCHAMTSDDVVTSLHDITRRYDVTVWHQMTSYVMKVNLHGPTNQEIWKIAFFNIATLTFDLWPWPSNSSEMSSRYTSPLNFRSVCQMVQSGDRRTDRTDFIPSTAAAGGNVKKKIRTSRFFFIFTSPTNRLDQIGLWKIRHPGNQLTMYKIKPFCHLHV